MNAPSFFDKSGSPHLDRHPAPTSPNDGTATPDVAGVSRWRGIARRGRSVLRRYPTIVVGGVIVGAMSVLAVASPWLGTVDPMAVAPAHRLQTPSWEHWFGTDMLGRDLYSRVLYGTRVSLGVGLSVAVLSVFLGVVVGLACGLGRTIDFLITRVMDGLMSIPAILLAISLMALTGPSIQNVIVAITIVEVPRVMRVVRGVMLSVREEQYVTAAVASGSSTLKILVKHIMPATFTPLLVQATYICAVAMIIEAGLSFIGAGLPPSIPSWGNVMAEGRVLWQIHPQLVMIPAVFLSLTCLAVNFLGDGLRDALDPRLAKQV